MGRNLEKKNLCARSACVAYGQSDFGVSKYHPNTSDKYKSVPNFWRAEDCVTISVVPEIKAPVRADRIWRDMVAFDGQVSLYFCTAKNSPFSRPLPSR